MVVLIPASAYGVPSGSVCHGATCRSSIGKRDPGVYFRPVTEMRADAERTLRQANPLFHAEKPKAPAGGFILFKSFSIVVNANPDSI
jgi:hypothetical protein